jgi:hypothetical protein
LEDTAAAAAWGWTAGSVTVAGDGDEGAAPLAREARTGAGGEATGAVVAVVVGAEGEVDEVLRGMPGLLKIV